MSEKLSNDRELVITRIFIAPRELVFKAWTDPTHLAKWWGPHGMITPVCEVDPRTGGPMLQHGPVMLADAPGACSIGDRLRLRVPGEHLSVPQRPDKIISHLRLGAPHWDISSGATQPGDDPGGETAASHGDEDRIEVMLCELIAKAGVSLYDEWIIVGARHVCLGGLGHQLCDAHLAPDRCRIDQVRGGAILDRIRARSSGVFDLGEVAGRLPVGKEALRLPGRGGRCSRHLPS